jgi:adenylate kinase
MTRTNAMPANPVKYRAILLFGAPGSGKGTQGKMIGCIPGFLHSSTGDIFRSLDKQSEMGQIFLRYSTRGELVPDEFTVKLWKQHMQNLVAAGKFNPATDIVVMDGIPRNVRQAELLSDTIDVVKIICLETSNLDQFVQRLKLRATKENRPDDADEQVIRNRMDVYRRETQPVLDFYPADRVARVEADQTIVRVLGDVVKVLVPLTDR